ncbi:GDT1-like protein C17G8.08c [Diplonema papillatum]|nr:GDT1-like protein C17G8.08c [Diplonema papillatum]
MAAPKLFALALILIIGLSSAEEAAVVEKADVQTATTGKLGEFAGAGTWGEGFLSSWSMILVSEIGDKTFFIACLMAMRNDRLVVFFGAISALTAMTILSAALGHIVPSLLPVKYTQMAAVILFTAFGIKLLNEARSMKDDDEEPEELAEAQAELSKKDDGDVEDPVVRIQPKKSRSMAAKMLGPVFVQAFTLTFVAEWGDRSQISTIVLAAAKNPYGVTLGGIIGHSICTGSAVMIGKKVSQTFTPRHVTWFGGILFVFFGIMTAYQLATPQ